MRSVPPLSTYVASGRACVLTLAELQDIARDVGIAPELVVRATASLGEVGSAPTRTLLARALAIKSNLGSVRVFTTWRRVGHLNAPGVSPISVSQ